VKSAVVPIEEYSIDSPEQQGPHLQQPGSTEPSCNEADRLLQSFFPREVVHIRSLSEGVKVSAPAEPVSAIDRQNGLSRCTAAGSEEIRRGC
jgi:hypothetical protein